MRVELKKISVTYEYEDIELPLYRRHDVGDFGTTVYTKVIEDDEDKLMAFSLTEYWDENIELLIEKNYSISDGSDYVLGNGSYKSSQQEFENALARFNVMLIKLNKE